MNGTTRLMLAAAAVVVFFPSLALADGGGPILLLLNFPLFTVGQIWIVAVEWVLLRPRIQVAPSTLFKWILLANLASAALCALGLPFVWAVMTAVLSSMVWDTEAGKLVFAIGTWIAGDESPHPTLALWATGVGFIVTFFPTVFIEWRLIRRWLAREEGQPPGLLRSVVRANLVSYLGLVVLTMVPILFGRMA